MIVNPNEPHIITRLKRLEGWANKTVDGVQYNIDGDIIHYGECNTIATEINKQVNIPNFKLAVGSRVTIKFINGSSSNNITLNVSDTGIKPVYTKNTLFIDNIEPYTLCTFIYTGSGYELVSDSYIYKGATDETDGIPGLFPKALAGQGRYLLHGDGKFYDDLTAIDLEIDRIKKRFTEFEESTNNRLVSIENTLKNGLVRGGNVEVTLSFSDALKWHWKGDVVLPNGTCAVIGTLTYVYYTAGSEGSVDQHYVSITVHELVNGGQSMMSAIGYPSSSFVSSKEPRFVGCYIY